MKPKDSDSILDALGQHARAEAADGLEDAGWEAVAAGKATEAQRSALERAARDAGADADAASELFEPLGDAAKERLLELAAPRDASAGSTVVRPLWRRTGPWFGALALAAAFALFFATRRGDDTTLAAIPSYELTISGGVAQTRGDAPAATVLVPGSRVVLTLRPATRVEGAVEARTFLVREGRSVPVALDATVTAEGAIRLTGVVNELAAEVEGAAELVVTITRPGAAHDPMGSASRSAQIARRPVVVKRSVE